MTEGDPGVGVQLPASADRAGAVFGVSVALAGALLLLGAPLLGAATVRRDLWALDHLCDVPLGARAALVAAVLLAAHPVIQRGLSAGLGRAVRALRAVAPALRWPALCGALFALLWALRQRNFELGDSALVMKWMTMGVHTKGLHTSYDEPLALLVHSLTYRVTHAMLGWGVEDAYALMSCLAGVAYAALMVRLWQGWAGTPTRAACGLALVGTTASVQLFFGYVENYALVALALMLYIALAAEALAGRRGLLAPSLALGLGMALHLLAGWLLPSLLYLCWRRRDAGLQGVAAAAAGVLLPFALVVACLTALGVPLASFGSTHVVHLKFIFLIDPASPQFRYAAGSWSHLAGLANQTLLVSMPGLLALAGALCLRRSRIDWEDPRLRFLALCALFAHVFAATFNPQLGPRRDWDLFAITGFLDALLGAWLLVGTGLAPPRDAAEAEREKRRLLAVVAPSVALALALTGSFVVSNASRSVAVDVRHAQAHLRAGDLRLRDGRTGDAAAHYEQVLSLEPRNPSALYMLGRLRWEGGGYAEAESFLRRYLDAAASRPGEAERVRIAERTLVELERMRAWAPRP